MKVKIWKLLSLIFIAIFAFSAVTMVHAASTLTPTSTISSATGTLAYDSGKSEVFALDPYGPLSVIPDSTNKVATTIETGVAFNTAHDIAYDSGKGEIFISSGTPNGEGETPTVTVISDSTNAVLTTITSKSWWTPMGMAYDSSKGEIFLCDSGNKGNVLGTVYVISDSDNSIVTSIPVGSYPAQAVYDSGKGEIFVANAGGTISVISDSTNTVVATVNVGTYPYGLAYDQSKGEVFVFNEYDGSVSVISDNSNTVITTITGIAASTNALHTIAFDSSIGELYVGDSVISDASNTIVAKLPAGLGNMVYNSGKGEVLGVSSAGLSVFSDSSSPSPTSAASPTSTAAPSPTIPEFSSSILFALATAMIAVTICAIAITKRKSPQPSFTPK